MQKRHHTRFFAMNRQDSDRSGNPLRESITYVTLFRLSVCLCVCVCGLMLYVPGCPAVLLPCCCVLMLILNIPQRARWSTRASAIPPSLTFTSSPMPASKVTEFEQRKQRRRRVFLLRCHLAMLNTEIFAKPGSGQTHRGGSAQTSVFLPCRHITPNKIRRSVGRE